MRKLLFFVIPILCLLFLAGCQSEKEQTDLPVAVTLAPSAAAPSIAPSASPLPLEGYIIGIDPGHQQHENSEKEPNSPNGSVQKSKVSSGTQGVVSKVPEYIVVLEVGLYLKDMLEEAGATVVMTRTVNEVDISNIERAQLMNESKVDIAVRLHCNYSPSEQNSGCFAMVPHEHPRLNECITAAETVMEEYVLATGIKKARDTRSFSDQTMFNWCEQPIFCIEMLFMSNKNDDAFAVSEEGQKKMALGIYNGLLKYFTGA